MSDTNDVSPTDPIEPSENALAVKFREGYELGQFDARNEMIHSLEGVIKSTTRQPSARALFIMNTHVDDLLRDGEIREDTRNRLIRCQIYTISDIVEKSAGDLLEITSFGQESMSQIHTLLGKRGLALKK